MKLKVLPPTLRKNNRYLTVDIKVKGDLNKDEFVGLIWDGCIRFWGELTTSNFNLWVMRFYEIDKKEGYNYYKAIIRCQRGFEDNVRAALCCVSKYNSKKIAINVIGLSGTIKASVNKFV